MTTDVHALLPDAAGGAGADRPMTALGGAGARRSASLPKLWAEVDRRELAVDAGVVAIVEDNIGAGIRVSMRLMSSTLRLGSWSTIWVSILYTAASYGAYGERAVNELSCVGRHTSWTNLRLEGCM